MGGDTTTQKERKAMIDPEEKRLSIRDQCKLLSVSRSTRYYKSVEKTDGYQNIKSLILEIWYELPTRGSRYIVSELRKRGYYVSRKKIGCLMKELKIRAMYSKKNLSKPNKEHVKYPYLLKDVEVSYPNHVWSIDITYIKTGKGFFFLTAIIDWYSRKILSWRLSNTLDNRFCIDALKEALKKYGKPEIFNTDQGVQFTAKSFTSILKSHQIKISMDGKGRALDNIFIERFWKTIKYEYLNIWVFEGGNDLKEKIHWFIQKYNSDRGHQSLNDQNPDDLYYQGMKKVYTVAS